MFDTLIIDWGSVRFGMAFGSTTTELVIPTQKTCLTQDIWKILSDEINTRNITQILVGIPMTFDFKPTIVSNQIQSFTTNLQKSFPEIKITEVNERHSTKNALSKNPKLTKSSLNHQSACEIFNYYISTKTSL